MEKKLKPLKVSDNYRLASSLAFLTYEEINRLLLHKYFDSVPDSSMADILNDPHDDAKHRGHCVGFARNFVSFVRSTAESLGDEGTVYICHYW